MANDTIYMSEKDDYPREKKSYGELVTRVYFSGKPETAKEARLKYTKPLVKKVEGPFNENDELVTELEIGKSYIYKATEHEDSILSLIKNIWWAEQLDDGKITDLEYIKGENPYLDEKNIVCFKYTVKECKKVRIYAYVAKPIKKVSIESNIFKLPIFLDKYKKAGFDISGKKLADDLHYGDGINLKTGYSKYSIEEIEGLNFLFKIQLNQSNSSLWFDFKTMVKVIFSTGELEIVAEKMIEHFKSNTGTNFTNSTLTKYIKKHPSALRFCSSMEELIKNRLKENNGYISKISFKNYNNGDETPRMQDEVWGHPRFNTIKDTFAGGLTICMNDTWSYEVLVTKKKEVDDKINITYKIKLFDHFGLDKPDVQKIYKYGAGFRAWFVLQHARNYKPFITEVEFEKSFEFVL